MAHPLRTLAHWLHLPEPEQDLSIAELAYDSRKIFAPANTLFVALVTAANDGHRYVQQAYDKGVRAFLVHQDFPAHYPDAALLRVPDTLQALQQLTAQHRQLFHYPVVGITGSNGKTTVKEWLFQLLNHRYTIVRTPKSFNSQIGVPLSVWDMAAYHDLAIFEAGISMPGEMERLEAILHPDIGVFTNIGPAHDEGFADREEKLVEKLRLFARVRQLVFGGDDLLVDKTIRAMYPGKQLISWGTQAHHTIHLLQREDTLQGCTITVRVDGNDVQFSIPFSDAASVENAMHCMAVWYTLGLPLADFLDRIGSLHHIPMRLELKEATGNSLLIYDCYNSDVRSLQVALDFMDKQARNKPATVILSDLLETGIPSDQLYQQIGDLLRSHHIQRLIAVGPIISAHVASIGVPECVTFPDTASLLHAIPALTFRDEAILLKGARAFAFEQVGKWLEEKIHTTVFEVDLTALAANIRAYRALLPPQAKVMAMVKAFAYGSGTHEVASVLQYHNVDYLAVAYAEEGIALRKHQIRLPIMVMNPDIRNLSVLRHYSLEPEVYSLPLLEAIVSLPAELQPAAIHIKVDTGMHRLGFLPQQTDSWLALVQEHGLRVASIFSHLVASDNPAHDAFTHQQAGAFTAVVETAVQQLGYRPLSHLANSAGAARFPEYAFDMVRIGLGMYGLDLSGKLGLHLQPVGCLRTVISQIKSVPAGETVGYGRAGKVVRDSRIATVAIGYADGYRRALGNGIGYMMVRGRRAPVIGNVCMDMTMLDITDIPDAREGDEVEVFGRQIPVALVARQANTIPYEIISGISQRVKRVYIEEM